ncbi:MAG: DUF4276 family protein [Actinobacteria bacterium]|nr:DUF4276 family protein [Actinomycetota bacterium]
MSLVTIATVVEGHGEVAALPVLLRRMAAEIAPTLWVEVPLPYRVGRQAVIRPGGLERVLGAVAEQAGAGVVVLLDADDDCPATLGPELAQRARRARPDLPVAPILANREFEAWFLAAAPSLGGHRGLAADLDRPAEAERPRDCKGWLSAHRTDGRAYKPVSDQAALAAVFDLSMARAHSRSFDKLWRTLAELLAGEGA